MIFTVQRKTIPNGAKSKNSWRCLLRDHELDLFYVNIYFNKLHCKQPWNIKNNEDVHIIKYKE